MKKILLPVFFLISLFFVCPISMAGDYKIGYVDMQRSVNESLAGKEAMQKFEEEVKKTEEDLMKDKEDVEKLGEIIKKQSMMLTEDVRREKEKDYLRKQRDFDRKVKDSKSELQLKEAELTNEILEELIPIVQKYGKDNNYSIIFQNEIRILLYASESLDLTDKVMVIYDAEYRKKKK